MYNSVQQFAPSRFSHASAIAPFQGGTILAFYSGLGECHETQKVYLFHTDKDGRVHGPAYLEENTGNPVLLKWRSGLRIIYSKFDKFFPEYRVRQWQYCSLWVRDVAFDQDKGEFQLSEAKPLVVQEPDRDYTDEENNVDLTGYLPRCNPIATPEGFLLPLYRERHPEFYGIVLHSLDGFEWNYQGRIGKEHGRCMQPTLWTENGKVHALLRNYNFAGVRHALYSNSEDSGKTWAEPENSIFYNANNSILAIEVPNKEAQRKEVLIIWNNDPQGRNNITLSTKTGKSIAILDRYGSYPSACVADNKLHIAYTAVADKLRFPYAKTAITVQTFDLGSVARYAYQKTRGK